MKLVSFVSFLACLSVISGAKADTPPVADGTAAKNHHPVDAPTVDQKSRTPDDAEPVVLDLISDVSAAAPDSTISIIGRFRIAPGWHICAPWPGNTGEPTRIEITASSDSKQIPINNIRFEYPVVWDRDNFELTSFGYENTLLAGGTSKLSGIPEGEKIQYLARARWLACKNSCVNGSSTAFLTIPVTSVTVPAEGYHDANDRPDFPAALDSGHAWLDSLKYEDGVWNLIYSLKGFESVDSFIPEWISGGDCLVESWEKTSGTGPGQFSLLVKLKGTDCLPFAGGYLKAVRKGEQKTEKFVFGAFSDPGFSPWRKNTTLSNSETTIEKDAIITNEKKTEGPSFSWYFLLLAFAGGLLLNVMPCVIPVIVPKLNHLVRTAVSYDDRHERHRMLLYNGLAYSAGIFLTMIGFAVTIVLLKTAGHQVGWGFQFQNPLFLAIMASVLMLMALGMLRVFPLQSVSHTDRLRELRIKRKKGVVTESFFTGLLVTFLGTPCTAPLLGPAAGFAFMAGTAQIFAFFVALALGFCLPFLALAVFPGWTRHLKNFQISENTNRWSHGLAFFLLATMVWLIGVIGDSWGLDAVSNVLWFLLVLSLLAWAYGIKCIHFENPGAARLEKAEQNLSADIELNTKTKASGKRELRLEWYGLVRRHRLMAGAVMFTILVLCGVVMLRFDTDTTYESRIQKSAVSTRGPVKWRKWSTEGVNRARGEGRPVFVDVTASWCMNCKANETLILNRVETADLFHDMGVVPFMADFSRRNPIIHNLISKHERAGVPLYLVYPPCSGEPAVLPEILTPGIVKNAITLNGPAHSCEQKDGEAE